MKYFLFLVAFGSSFAFSHIRYNNLTKPLTNYLAFMQMQVPNESYQQAVSQTNSDRRNLLTGFRGGTISIDSCRKYFTNRFVYYIFPHWIGTAWDYNGYSNVPGKDKLIACGYFVSTPLKHMGFNWNRYELAKMYSRQIVETTCSEVKTYKDKWQMITDLKEADDMLYLVGLDNHVGMLLKEGDRLWFIHSNYIGLEGPVKEIASASMALDNSEVYWLGAFLNDVNVEKWLRGTYIPTPRDK
jgi:hypothetical protein